MANWISIQRRIAVTTVAVFVYAAVGAATQVGSPAQLNLSRLVAVGDSLLAGYQNDSLLSSQQVNSPASLIADQAGVPLPLPLIGAPGIPNVIVDVDPGPPPTFFRAPGTSPGRLNPLVQPMNLAVPGHTVRDALVTRPTLPIDSVTDLVLGVPGFFGGIARSQVEWAEALSPTTILLWIGPSDVLGTIYVASPAALTPLANFATDYATVMQRLAATGATLVVVNVPDVTKAAFLTSAEGVAQLVGLPLGAIAPLLGIAPGDSVTPNGLALIPSILANPALGPLPPNVVLTSGEAITIRGAIDAYNSIIAAQAAQYDAVLVDVHDLFDQLDKQGHVVLGRRLTTAFFGGIFSLDGLHPTNTGNAIVANEIIKQMNRQLDANVSPLSIARIAADDPLLPAKVPPGQTLASR
jgi:hypothetical protein